MPVQAASPAGSEIQQARLTGEPVQVAAATTPTDTVMANPNGTFTLKRHAVPVRKRVDGVWRDLDATLRANADGSLSPGLSGSELTFSGGGAGPLAVLRKAGKTLAISAPMTLPAPTVLGATATYPQVLPGVDLQVTATTRGGFSQVFVVHSATAAANPALRSLTMKTATQGLTLTAEASGAMAAKDNVGSDVFTAAAPVMWSSPAQSRVSAQKVAGRELAARTAPVGLRLTAGAITLTPDPAVLSGPDTAYPVFIDPAWDSPTTGGVRNGYGYASVAKAFPTSNKWNNTADSNPDNMQLGWNNSPWHARTMVNFWLDLSKLNGATITEAHIDATGVYSGSCTATKTRVFAPVTTLTSANATWNDWYNSIALGNEVGSAVFMGGYNSSCSQHPSVAFPVLPGILSAVAAGRSVQTFVFTGDTNETSDTSSYKEISLSSLALQITYNHAPTKPAGLTTSPQTSCTGTVGAVGDGEVMLYAPVSDPDGMTVGVRYELWKSSVPGTLIVVTDPETFRMSSPNTAVRTVPQALLKAQAGSSLTEFSWRVQIFDGFAYSPWSDTCRFNYDPTRPGAPGGTAPAPGATQIGLPVTIAVSKPVGGTIPASYLYQLNAGAPATVVADAAGNASITVTPTRRTNTLTINSLSAGGNPSVDALALTFTTAPLAANAKDADFTGDGVADYLSVGSVNNLPAGVWLAPGKNTTQVAVNAGNIGSNGNGVVGDMLPANFNSAQLIPGHFRGTGLQDVMAYYPATGTASIISGNGDGSILMPQISGNQSSIFDTELKDENVWPTQLANAGDSYGNTDSTADLIGVAGPSGSRHLNYYFYASPQNQQGIIQLTKQTPAGDMLWDQWKIATAQVTVGSNTQTDMFLWKPANGALHLWRDLDVSTGDLVVATSYQLAASGWNTAGALTLQAADIDANGTPDLWATGANRTATPYVTSGATITAKPAQTLSTATHSWALVDKPATANSGDSIVTTTDNAGTGITARPLSGAGGAAWNTGDVFSPDTKLNGTGAMLASAGQAVATNSSFTLSARVKPATAGGTVLSQDGVNTAGFRLYADAATKSWRFAMSTSDVAAPAWDVAIAANNSVQIGVWTQLTVTYNQANGWAKLYVNGVEAALLQHTTTWNSTGALRAGAYRTSAAGFGDYHGGQVAAIQIWNQIVEPSQDPTAGAYYKKITPTRFADTRDGTGGITGPLTDGAISRVKIAGANGIPATGVTGVALNITNFNATGSGYITAYPDLTTRPSTANVNFSPGQVNSEFAIVPVGTNGYVNFFTSGGGNTAGMFIDVSGYFTTDSAMTGISTYTPMDPVRYGNTMSNTDSDGKYGRIPAGGTWTYTIAGVNGVPTGVTAVAVNITTGNTPAPGYFNTWEQGQSQPNVSGLQYQTGGNSAAFTIVPVNPATGQFQLFSPRESEVLIDVLGYFMSNPSGQKYHALGATRMLDTRQDNSPLPANATINLSPGNTITAGSPTLIIGLASVWPSAYGYLNTYPSGITQPPTSTLNYAAGQVISNLAFVKVGTPGTIAISSNQPGGGSTTVIVDCIGYFSAG